MTVFQPHMDNRNTTQNHCVASVIGLFKIFISKSI